MKNMMKFASIAMLAAAAAFAGNDDQKNIVSNKDITYKTTYLRFGAMSMPCKNNYLIAPSVCGGWLYRENKQGVDISVNCAGLRQNKKDAFSCTAPKVQYLRYFSNSDHGTYFGIGSSFLGQYVNDREKLRDADGYVYSRRKSFSSYAGLAANASLGYFHKLGNKLQTSAQLGVGMPTPLAIHSKGKIYRPLFELNVGLGF